MRGRFWTPGAASRSILIPASQWKESNTNYVIAGLTLEKVSGEPLLQFLQQEIFIPLKMKSVADTHKAKLW